MWPSNQGEEEPTFQLYFVVTKSFFLTAVSSYTCLLLTFDFFLITEILEVLALKT